MVWFVVVAGCSSPPPPSTEPPPPPKFFIRGRVEPDAGITLGSGVVALIAPAGGAVQNLIREYGLLGTPTGPSSNVWPYVALQRAIDDFQKSKVITAVTTGSDGKFDFPDDVLPGDYVVVVGIPIVHDPGVGKPVPRDWPENLVADMPIKLMNRDLSVPSRNAWLLRVTMVNSDRSDIVLGSSERISFPKVRPTDEQIGKIRTRSLQLDPIRRRYDTMEKQFRDADTKARQTGQPQHVRQAREHEAEFKKEQDALQQANEDLDQYFGQMLGQ